MPDTGWIVATGDGRALINGGSSTEVLFIEYQFTSVTNPKVRFVGTDYPRRVQFGGSVQLLTQDRNVDDSIVYPTTFDWVLNWERGELAPIQLQYGVNATWYLRWLLPPGVEVNFRVYF